MRRLIATVSRMAAAAFLVAAAGCGGGGNYGIESLPSPTGQFQALKFTLTTDKKAYAVGEPVNATFTVTNTGSQTVYYSSIIGNGNLNEDITLIVQQGSSEVYDSDNHGGKMGGIAFHVPLAPGASAQGSATWRQGYDSGLGSGETTGLPQVPAGQYTLRAYTNNAFYGYDTETATFYATNFAAPLLTITIQ